MEKGAVNQVKNEGMCGGAVWAFTSAAVLEGSYFLKTGALDSFSEQQLVDCLYTYNPCNEGGFPVDAFKYWQTSAAETSTSYPFTQSKGKCNYKPELGVAKVKSYNQVQGTTDQLTAAVHSQPASVGIEANVLQSYSSGVIQASECGTSINHTVLMVGYDVDQAYFRMQNSWGSNWGEEGYFRVQRGPNTCGILELINVAEAQ